jgi:hypothetical protein
VALTLSARTGGSARARVDPRLHESREDVMGSMLYRRAARAMAVTTLGLLVALSSTGTAAAQPSAYSTFKDSFNLSTGANQLAPVARLIVPAGRYVIIAKLFTGPPQNGLNQHVRCDLSAGSDFDRVIVNHDATIGFVSLSLNVVHRFVVRSRIRLDCGFVFAAGTTSLGFIKVTAISVNSLSNVPSP